MTAALRVSNLTLRTQGPTGPVTLVDDVSFEVARGETLCLVGESGSGKSLTMLAVMNLLPPGVWIESGEILLDGRDVRGLTDRELRAIRGRDLAMIFQDPMTSLNPLRRVGKQIADTVRMHGPRLSRAAVARRVVELLELVGVPDAATRARSYPHQWSGGMRQRAMIATAMAHDPAVLIADEPTTALDVTIQAQVMDVLEDARIRSDSALILITHDLGLVAGVADRVAIMYSGRIVETGDVFEIFANPAHPYTAGLLASVLDSADARAYAIPGNPPSPATRPAGCAFAPRCAAAGSREDCRVEVPRLAGVGTASSAAATPHRVACHVAAESAGAAVAEIAS